MTRRRRIAAGAAIAGGAWLIMWGAGNGPSGLGGTGWRGRIVAGMGWALTLHNLRMLYSGGTASAQKETPKNVTDDL
jgi:hypothetical protein